MSEFEDENKREIEKNTTRPNKNIYFGIFNRHPFMTRDSIIPFGEHFALHVCRYHA